MPVVRRSSPTPARSIAPATKAQVNANSVPLPASLFSHFDQTAAWQAIASNGGSAEHVGWGGAVADLIESMNMNSNSMFTCISTAGIALFLSGQTSFQLNVTSAGPIPDLRIGAAAVWAADGL